MGCFHSKKENSDLHSNVFRVVNIDENGLELCSGQLEITESDIVLYREGRDSTVWPLHSLRRYGFEGEIFSFESGRRCETGEGIYAFRCRRASLLFRHLQQQIQLRNVIHDSVPYPVSRLTGTPSPQSRQTLQATVVHRSSIDNGQNDNTGNFVNNNLPLRPTVPRTVTQSPRSPSSTDILEVMPLYPRAQGNNNHVSNVYQLRDFKKEHNNNQTDIISPDLRHVYCNDLNRDLAILRNNLRQETALNTMRDIEDETRFLESRYINDSVSNNHLNHPLSPTLSSSSEHYAQLSIEQQEAARLYVNMLPSEVHGIDADRKDTPGTPLTPKPVEYTNLLVGIKPEINSYANLALGELESCTNPTKQIINFNIPPDPLQKNFESDTLTSMSPVEELEVNYAVLDIDTNKETTKGAIDLASPESHSYNSSRNESTTSCSSQSRGRLVSQNSFEKPVTNIPVTVTLANTGYTTIDFDKTVALTSVAAGGDVDLDGTRKTRHNSSSVMCGSPVVVEKSRNN